MADRKRLSLNQTQVSSWGRMGQHAHHRFTPHWEDDISLPKWVAHAKSVLPFGMGRSYGDSCLNTEGGLIETTALNRFLYFDRELGMITCEAGVTLADILALVVPSGWFLPVTPGTKFVTLGGAIANDVHGKNHHVRGTFGCHIDRIELLRSDGQHLSCSPDHHPELFAATIGGLGLTGLITSATLKLIPANNAYIEREAVKFANFEAFFKLSHDSDTHYEYTVAWMDSIAKGQHLGRGIFYRGNHAKAAPHLDSRPHPQKGITIPGDAPTWLLNPLAMRLFNFAYYHRQQTSVKKDIVHYDPFFYPLDSIHHWNRLYGRRGFYQFQCVIPLGREEITIKILETVARSGRASFLTVAKKFGPMKSPGILSFPIRGITLALDFANRGPETFHFLRSLETLVLEAGGRVYPAKDAMMSPQAFQSYFPNAHLMTRWIDPGFSSQFWRRVHS